MAAPRQLLALLVADIDTSIHSTQRPPRHRYAVPQRGCYASNDADSTAVLASARWVSWAICFETRLDPGLLDYYIVVSLWAPGCCLRLLLLGLLATRKDSLKSQGRGWHSALQNVGCQKLKIFQRFHNGHNLWLIFDVATKGKNLRPNSTLKFYFKIPNLTTFYRKLPIQPIKWRFF